MPILSNLWNRLIHHIAKYIPGGLANLYIRLRMQEKAATLIKAKFEKLAPLEARIAMNNYEAIKWDMPGACKFLMGLKPEIAVAILNQWYNNEKFSNIAFRSGVLLNMMLTMPAQTFFNLEEDALKEKLTKIITLVADTNKPLLKERFETGPVDPSLKILELVASPPAIIPFLLNDIADLCPFFLVQLENKNPDRFNFLFEKFPVNKSREIKKKMGDMKMNKLEKEAKKGELKTKAEALEDKKLEKDLKISVAKKEESIGNLADKISDFLGMYIPPESNKPESSDESPQASDA
ncbi:hypothetical protein [Desulfonema magnum]|uniref:Uncharacterized protein n=1 Tax=Desulfonema magnum TaxID=45655 RepID=A0A975BHS6_9BACT|nr:hypothetical protein [Desulfonema magnum]QTA85696.1 Uncharacterized protein dnm_017100 [Desulfonema magnum]